MSWFTMSMAQEWMVVLLVTMMTLVWMQWYDKLPRISAIQGLMTVLNSRGGNIFVLMCLSIYFFYRAEHMYYIVLSQVQSGSVASDNGVALNGLLFDTSAASSVLGALLKTMSPESSSPPPPSNGGMSMTKTTTVVSSDPETSSKDNSTDK